MKKSWICPPSTFSIFCCTIMKYVLPDPWRNFYNYFSDGSAETVPNKT